MKSLFKSLSRQREAPVEADPLLYIIVAQYQRADFDLGSEHEFHWAIAAVSNNLANAPSEQCRCYQVFDRTYTNENRTEWIFYAHREAILRKTGKWRGGVVIGQIMSSELEALDQVRQ